MISIANVPNCAVASDKDFTLDEYRILVRLARSSYLPSRYLDIPWGKRFILWRHDCDYSLNRALRLARIEREEGLCSTFFVNLHCDFYNVLEKGQSEIVRELISLGHDLGLHFDAAFYETRSEADLHEQVGREAQVLEGFFGVRPVAFSFHNPTAFHLTCEEPAYGGLVNCYSKKFKSEVPYCSDSNGYWRFRRLRDVLTSANDGCLQVLTHPGWWQEVPMAPRARIYRSAFGRARRVMEHYDRDLKDWGRENLSGFSQSIRFLESVAPRQFELCDYLWNVGQFRVLFTELWRMHEQQLVELCKVEVLREWGVSAAEASDVFSEVSPSVDLSALPLAVFGQTLSGLTGIEHVDYLQWRDVRDQLRGQAVSISDAALEEGCVFISSLIDSFASWGTQSDLRYDGIGPQNVDVLFPRTGDRTSPLYSELGNCRLSIDVISTRWKALKAFCKGQ